ncbi:hypothetical protein BC829DRAFT_439804 [Chytridium lagenaria]|nr:hypothetical protein BC829DRAFT_439804 [Chytridium lagenaria]
MNESDNAEEAPRRNEPRASYQTYFIFLLFGVTSLIAWNTWITANDHYRVVLKDSPYADSFQTYFAVTYMTTNLSSLCLLLFIGGLITPSTRIKMGLTINASIFTVAGILSLFAQRINPSLYFAITLGAALVAAVFAFASQYTSICTQALSTGQGFAGLVPAVTVWVFLFLDTEASFQGGESATKSFAFSAILTMSAGLGYYFLPKPHTEDYVAIPTEPEDAQEAQPTSSAEDAVAPLKSSLLSFLPLGLLWKVKLFAIAMFLNFVVTLGLFPAILTQVDSVSENKGKENLFIASMFVVFNIADVCGKALPGISQARIQSGARLFVISLLRVFGDAGFFILAGAIASSGGYMATNIFMEVPKTVSAGEEFAATDIVVFILASGLASGSLLSTLLIRL